ncbi:hypothetical protein [Ramlibacter sp. AN1133]|uniref:hypothetical protein n=1 Tax=Ramlibacter sp. AN1133 TaxID=3133429 RepID=UPI0030BE821A
MNSLFSVTYRPGPAHPAVSLVCQAIDVDGEMLLWIDGINLEHPMLVPVSACKRLTLLGTFREFAQTRLQATRAVLQESQGEHSPTLLARAILYMEADPQLTAHEALELAYDQALDLIDADNTSAMTWSRVSEEQAALAA